MDHIFAVIGTGKRAACSEINDNELHKSAFYETVWKHRWEPRCEPSSCTSQPTAGACSRIHLQITQRSCCLWASEQPGQDRGGRSSWTKVPCGMCGGEWDPMQQRPLSTDQHQHLTAQAHPHVLWSHHSSVGPMTFWHCLQLFRASFSQVMVESNPREATFPLEPS